jgi:hypothetical protein
VAALLAAVLAWSPVSASVWMGNSGIWVNSDAFSVACVGHVNTYPSSMRSQAVTGMGWLGFTPAYNVMGAGFTRSAFLGAIGASKNGMYSEAGIYIHSHGDVYNSSSIRAAFLQDPGTSRCNDYTQDYVSNFAVNTKWDTDYPPGLVIMAACYLGTPAKGSLANNMPEAFNIPKNQTVEPNGGRDGFYMGYDYETYDSSMYRFEGYFFNYMHSHLATGSFKQAFTYAKGMGGYSYPDSANPFVANWFGDPNY